MKIEIEDIICHIFSKNNISRIIFDKAKYYSKVGSNEILIDLVDNMPGNLIGYTIQGEGLESTLKAMKKWFKANRKYCIKEVNGHITMGFDQEERRELTIKIIESLAD